MLRDIRVETWIVNQRLDFSIQGSRPITKIMELIDKMTNPVSAVNNPLPTYHDAITLLTLNTYETEDNWISIGETTYSG